MAKRRRCRGIWFLGVDQEEEEEEERDLICVRKWATDEAEHLDVPLSRSEVIHFARRVGYSIKSLGLSQYVIPREDTVHEQLTLKEAITKLLSEENLAKGLGQELPPHIMYKNRMSFWVIWNQEQREKGNHWETIGR